MCSLDKYRNLSIFHYRLSIIFYTSIYFIINYTRNLFQSESNFILYVSIGLSVSSPVVSILLTTLLRSHGKVGTRLSLASI